MTRCILFAVVLAVAACSPSDVPSAPTASSPAPSQLMFFVDERSGVRTSEARDADGEVALQHSGELIWVADGTRFAGFRWGAMNYIFAPRICAYCAYEIRFGASRGQTRAYVTVDYGENNSGTIVDLSVVNGELITTQTEAGPPGTFALSGRVSERTATGQTPITFANIKPNRYNWLGVGSDQNGSYNLRWLDAGTWSISISKEGSTP